MKQLRNVMCLLTALTLCLGTAACGQKSEEEVSLTSQSAALLSGSDSQAETETTEAEDEEDEDDDEDDDAPVDVKKVTVKKRIIVLKTAQGTEIEKAEQTQTEIMANVARILRSAVQIVLLRIEISILIKTLIKMVEEVATSHLIKAAKTVMARILVLVDLREVVEMQLQVL